MLSILVRPEDKAAKKERLLAEAAAREEGKEVSFWRAGFRLLCQLLCICSMALPFVSGKPTAG